MAMLLALSPFLAFLVSERLLGIIPALCAGCAVAIALVMREHLRGGREVRVLELGTAVLFGVLALAATFMTDVPWSVGLVRLVVDCGLMLLMLCSVALGRPVTLAIARAEVTPEFAASPAFLHRSRLIAVTWASAFGVLAIADLVMILQPSWPLTIPIAIGGAGLIGAFKIPQKLSRPAA